MPYREDPTPSTDIGEPLTVQGEPIVVPQLVVPEKMFHEPSPAGLEPNTPARPEAEKEEVSSKTIGVGDVMHTLSGTRELLEATEDEKNPGERNLRFRTIENGVVKIETISSALFDATIDTINHVDRKTESGELKAEQPVEKPEDEATQKEVGENAVKEAEEKEEQKREKAFAVLADPKIMSMEPIARMAAFREATGKDLNAAVEAKLGGRFLVENEADVLERESNNARIEDRSKAMQTYWERLSQASEEEAKKYMTADLMDPKKFGVHLGKVAFGLGIDQDGLSRLVNTGYDPEHNTVGSWFGGTKVKIPSIDGRDPLQFKDKDELKKRTLDESAKMEREAKERADTIIETQKEKLDRYTKDYTIDVIKEAVEAHNLEKQLKQDTEQKAKEEQQRIEQEATVAKEKPEKPEKKKKTAKKTVKKKR